MSVALFCLVSLTMSTSGRIPLRLPKLHKQKLGKQTDWLLGSAQLDLLMQYFYGIRCLLGHGSSGPTQEGALKLPMEVLNAGLGPGQPTCLIPGVPRPYFGYKLKTALENTRKWNPGYDFILILFRFLRGAGAALTIALQKPVPEYVVCRTVIAPCLLWMSKCAVFGCLCVFCVSCPRLVV